MCIFRYTDVFSAQIQSMMPKLKSKNFEGMELIRPMNLIREKDILKWRDMNNLHFIQCACHFTDTCSSCREDGTSASKRMETKQLIADTIISYKQHNVRHSFLDTYDDDLEKHG